MSERNGSVINMKAWYQSLKASVLNGHDDFAYSFISTLVGTCFVAGQNQDEYQMRCIQEQLLEMHSEYLNQLRERDQ